MFYFCCAASSEVDLIHPFALVRSRAQSLLYASVFKSTRCGVAPFPRHSMTTVVEFPIERTPRRIPMQWHASRDSTLRLPSQPAWNDAGVGALRLRVIHQTMHLLAHTKSHKKTCVFSFLVPCCIWILILNFVKKKKMQKVS